MYLYYVHIYIMCVWISTIRDSRTCETCAYVVSIYMYYYVSKNVDYINHSNLL